MPGRADSGQAQAIDVEVKRPAARHCCCCCCCCSSPCGCPVVVLVVLVVLGVLVVPVALFVLVVLVVCLVLLYALLVLILAPLVPLVQCGLVRTIRKCCSSLVSSFYIYLTTSVSRWPTGTASLATCPVGWCGAARPPRPPTLRWRCMRTPSPPGSEQPW